MSQSRTWFEELFGFAEEGNHSYHDVQSMFEMRGTQLTSIANGRSFNAGTFTTPTLQELRRKGRRALRSSSARGQRRHGVHVTHTTVADIMSMHYEYPGAVFQAASQFNCLEFPDPGTTPEHGITQYAFDNTQGPACALACAAGTVLRNYLVKMPGGGRGQTAARQLNMLDELEEAVDNGARKYFLVKNGYITSTSRKLAALANVLSEDMDALVKVGLHEGVGVTFSGRTHGRYIQPSGAPTQVTQVYCSAVSIGYSGIAAREWELLAYVVLDAIYEATLWAAVLNAQLTGVRQVFLTFVGGGVFANPKSWIAASIGRAVQALNAAGADLDVHVCHYRTVDGHMARMIDAACSHVST
ncbi:hypothetical protein JKP88DRAFT_161766 [Tribonema minus]|uniref:Macro domain-containing protein n=1 Tax=Tribonema minus TaxID=303371 RepID=A0A835Z6K4_9STRA|nr:hypothetical protein JKP88DRAFT_161766 [Tribonema minus]